VSEIPPELTGLENVAPNREQQQSKHRVKSSGGILILVFFSNKEAFTDEFQR